MQRSYSDKFKSGKSDFDLYLNRNADWIKSPLNFKITYIVLILVFVAIFKLANIEATEVWSVTNITHGVVSHILCHTMLRYTMLISKN